MAKIYGLFGSMTGKLADVVMTVRNGEQIARKYQPVVFNPSTPAQVAQRAKLKLMSQLSAIMAPVIAIARAGSVSSRNMFTKVNFRAATFIEETDTASINLEDVQLTKSVVAIGSFNSAARTAENVQVSLVAANVPADIDRVVYAMFAKEADDSLEYRGSVVATTRGTGAGAFQTDLPLENRAFVVYAYGIRDNSENARAIFGNITAPTAESVAKLIVNHTLLEDDVTLTKTVGIEVAAIANANAAMEPTPAPETRTKKKE